MFATIINDCHDNNARGRQTTRLSSLLETAVNFVSINSDLEAALEIVDIIDAADNNPSGVILVNIAPRGGEKQWENGSPFAFTIYKDTLIIGTVDGFVFSGLKKIGLLEHLNLIDTEIATKEMLEAGFILSDQARRIPDSQFRSFDLLPRLAAFIFSGYTISSEPYDVDNIPDLPPAVWCIDNFGNCKTTVSVEDLSNANHLTTRYGKFGIIENLSDVPDNTDAVVVGSSGFGDKRWLEMVSQKQSFAKKHSVKIGDDITVNTSHFKSATGNR